MGYLAGMAHAKPQARPPADPKRDAEQPEEKVYTWYTFARIADNDYRIVSCQSALPPEIQMGPKMTIPSEVFDRWHVDAAEMLEKAQGEFST